MSFNNFYGTYIVHHPEDGKVLSEYLESSRNLIRGPRNWIDVLPEGTLTKLLPSQAPQKVLEACLEKLRVNPFDLDAIHRIARTAQSAGWHALVIVALSDVLRNSATVKAPGSKLLRETKLSLGRAFFKTGDHKASGEMLNGFQNDPTVPKDVHQMIKDAAACIATKNFSQNSTAHQMATAQSVTLATQSPEERSQTEITELEDILRDPKLESGKSVSAALRLADLHIRTNKSEKAVSVLEDVRQRFGFNGEIEKKLVSMELSKRDRALADLAIQAKDRPNLKPTFERLSAEREEFTISALSGLAEQIPNDPDIHLNLGEALYVAGERLNREITLKMAIAHLQFEFKTDEQSNRARLLLAQCFLALNLPIAAEFVLNELLSRLEQVKKSAEFYLEAQYLLGFVREKLGDRSGAMHAYVSVIGKDINYEDAFERLKHLNELMETTSESAQKQSA